MKGLPLDRPGLPIEEIGHQGWNALRGVVPRARPRARAPRQDDDGAGAVPPSARRRRLGDHLCDADPPARLPRCRRQPGPRRERDRRAARAALHRGRARARPGVRAVLPGRLHGRRRVDGVSTRRRAAPRAVHVLVEVGQDGGRAGCRTVDEAFAVAEAIAGVDAFLARVVEVFERIGDLLPERPLLTAGGSAFFDRVAGGPERGRPSRGWPGRAATTPARRRSRRRSDPRSRCAGRPRPVPLGPVRPRCREGRGPAEHRWRGGGRAPGSARLPTRVASCRRRRHRARRSRRRPGRWRCACPAPDRRESRAAGVSGSPRRPG